MDGISLSGGEWKLMNLLWDKKPRTVTEMVEALKGDTDWSGATVNIMLSRLSQKGAVMVEKEGRIKQYYPVLDRNSAVRLEAQTTLNKVRFGGLGLLISTMAGEVELSDNDIDELTNILKEGRNAQ